MSSTNFHDVIFMSKVKDMSLAPEGVRKIEWVQKHMPVLEHILTMMQ